MGHEFRLKPPNYVKPYVRRQKNDAAGTEAICEAVTRLNMRFVPIKSADRRSVLTLHRSRELLVGSGREFAAFLGLVPRQNSSGGKDRLGRISKMGDGYLRKLLAIGATSVMRRIRTGVALASADWVRTLLERRPARVVTVAMANKTARFAWAVMMRGNSTGRRPWPDRNRDGPSAVALNCRGTRGNDGDDLNAAAGRDIPRY